MARRLARGALAAAALALVLLPASTFVVREWQQAVVIRLGNPVRTATAPGLYFNLPVVERVQVLPGPGRLLTYDAEPGEVYTADKKTLVVNNYVVWRILDPLLFYQSSHSLVGGTARVDDIVWSVLRNELGRHPYDEIIRTRRDGIMSAVTREADAKARAYGISVVDVRIQRVDLPTQNTQSVFQRMASERARIAQLYLSEGEAEATKIRARTDREVAEVLAQARRRAEEIRGLGDAEAARIYAEAYARDPEFYAFYRSLRAYEQAIGEGTVLLLDREDPLWRYLSAPAPPR